MERPLKKFSFQKHARFLTTEIVDVLHGMQWFLDFKHIRSCIFAKVCDEYNRVFSTVCI